MFIFKCYEADPCFTPLYSNHLYSAMPTTLYYIDYPVYSTLMYSRLLLCASQCALLCKACVRACGKNKETAHTFLRAALAAAEAAADMGVGLSPSWKDPVRKT